MSQLRFLCDEDVSGDIVRYLRGVEQAIDVLAVGEQGAPPKGTPDSDVYSFAATVGRTLISSDVGTMLSTVTADLTKGGHNWGTIMLKCWYPVARYGTDLHLIWYCDTADDWVDRIDFIPY